MTSEPVSVAAVPKIVPTMTATSEPPTPAYSRNDER